MGKTFFEEFMEGIVIAHKSGGFKEGRMESELSMIGIYRIPKGNRRLDQFDVIGIGLHFGRKSGNF
jgi:hypothetical protein